MSLMIYERSVLYLFCVLYLVRRFAVGRVMFGSYFSKMIWLFTRQRKVFYIYSVFYI